MMSKLTRGFFVQKSPKTKQISGIDQKSRSAQRKNFVKSKDGYDSERQKAQPQATQ